MRIRLLILFVIGAFLTGCKKENDNSKEINGTWNWVKQTNDSWPAVDKTPQSTGINESVTFKDNQTYSIVRNNVHYESGTFTTASFTASSGVTSTKIIFKKGFGMDSIHYFKVSGTSLTFSMDYSGGAGGGIRFYERQ